MQALQCQPSCCSGLAQLGKWLWAQEGVFLETYFLWHSRALAC